MFRWIGWVRDRLRPIHIEMNVEKARDSGKPALVDVVINRDVYSSGTSNQTMYK